VCNTRDQLAIAMQNVKYVVSQGVVVASGNAVRVKCLSCGRLSTLHHRNSKIGKLIGAKICMTDNVGEAFSDVLKFITIIGLYSGTPIQ
jgi:hypothetical protein